MGNLNLVQVGVQIDLFVFSGGQGADIGDGNGTARSVVGPDLRGNGAIAVDHQQDIGTALSNAMQAAAEAVR